MNRATFLLALIAGLCSLSAPQEVGGLSEGVFTAHNDNARTGQNLYETVLTPKNVNAAQFGKIFGYLLDGESFSQPLYVSQVSVKGRYHNVAYVTTENDSVYAFDADGLSDVPLWKVSLVLPSATPIPCGDTGDAGICPWIGITGTPVIDPAAAALYVVAATKENGQYYQRLHALDLATGAEKLGGPVEIQASVPGTGYGCNEGICTFDALVERQRAALLLLPTVQLSTTRTIPMVVIAWASHADRGLYHGWLIGYNSRTLKQVGLFNVTPNGARGGIWQSGAGLAADIEGNIFFQSANGTFSASSGGSDYADSLIRISTNGGHFTVEDYFTPFDQAYLDDQDLDFGSGGIVLLPPQAGARYSEAVSLSKRGYLYLTDRNNLGHYSPTSDHVVSEIFASASGFWSTPAYFSGSVYVCGTNDRLMQYSLNKDVISSDPISSSTNTFSYPGTTPSISANGGARGIAWAIESRFVSQSQEGPAILHAYDATNLAVELYNSDQAGTRDQPGNASSFSVPTVYNGHVYFSTLTDFNIFGLLTRS